MRQCSGFYSYYRRLENFLNLRAVEAHNEQEASNVHTQILNHDKEMQFGYVERADDA